MASAVSSSSDDEGDMDHSSNMNEGSCSDHLEDHIPCTSRTDEEGRQLSADESSLQPRSTIGATMPYPSKESGSTVRGRGGAHTMNDTMVDDIQPFPSAASGIGTRDTYDQLICRSEGDPCEKSNDKVANGTLFIDDCARGKTICSKQQNVVGTYGSHEDKMAAGESLGGPDHASFSSQPCLHHDHHPHPGQHHPSDSNTLLVRKSSMEFLTEMFLSDIQPLPTAADGISPVTMMMGYTSASSRRRRRYSIPGAFRVAGRPIDAGSDAVRRSRRRSRRHQPRRDENPVPTAAVGNTTEEAIIGGAVVVETGSSASDDPENVDVVGRSSADLMHRNQGDQPSSEEQEVVEAKIIRQSCHHQEERPVYLNMILFLVVLGIILGGIVALLVSLLVYPTTGACCSSNSQIMNSNNNTMTATPATPAILYEPFQPDLPPPILKGIQEVGSIYYKANAWMQNDPNLHEYYACGRQIQRFQLVLFFYASGGPHYWFRKDDWLSYTIDECNWYTKHTAGPICDDQQLLTVLNLTNNNLTGQYFQSTSLSGWPMLRIFDISYNNMGGEPPTFVSAATANSRMEEFVVSHNQFHGRLAAEGGSIPAYTNLRVVKLDSNLLFGSLRPMIFPLLPKLEVFNMSNNLYDQEITMSIKHCINLTYLGLANNAFSGRLPSQLGLLPRLKELDVSGNEDINGSIPTELGFIQPDLTRIDIDGTAMEGAVPEDLCSRIISENKNNNKVVMEEGGPSSGGGDKYMDIIANCSRVQCCSE